MFRIIKEYGLYHNSVVACEPLYLCAGGDDWEVPLRQELVESTPLVQEIMQKAAAANAAEVKATAEGALTPAVVDHPANPYISNGADDTAMVAAVTPNDTANTVSIPNKKTEPSTTTPPTNAPSKSAPPSKNLATSANGNGSATPGDRLESPAGLQASTDAVNSDAEQSGAAVTVLSPAELHTAGRAIFDNMQVCR